MDIGGGPVKQLTYRTRYTAPDISPDGKTIVAVSTTPELRCSLVFTRCRDRRGADGCSAAWTISSCSGRHGHLTARQ
ncbi:MAG: hypothetical protein MZV63_70895 [Marinilabiliales bacterium]|nr:hypothetical protein [Marinilabiliales bacterium]